MSILGVNGSLVGEYQYANRIQKTATSRTSFTEMLQKTAEEDTSRVDAYTKYLSSKYGKVTIQSIGKDKASLERAGKSMSGSDVVIAPNILEQMSNDSQKAAYYEGKIDDFFNAKPKLTAQFAAKGLDYQPCGVVVHEDGSVTYIGGCSDSPERVAEVNAINKAKREKKAAQRKADLERSREAADERKEQMEIIYKHRNMTDFLTNQSAVSSWFTYAGTPTNMSSVIAAYKMNINGGIF